MVLVSVLALTACSPGRWKFSERNDYFTFLNNDNDYTQGVRLENETQSGQWAVGQDIYTPANKRLNPPDPEQRPYAGLIYGERLKYDFFQDDATMLYGVRGGIVGRAALGKEAQCGVHALLGQYCPAGWSSQLGNEIVGSAIGGVRKWQPTALGLNESTLVVELGTLSTAIRAQSRVRADFGRFFYYAGPGANIVIRDVLLDGNTFKDSASVNKKWFVSEMVGAIGWKFDKVSVSWFIAVRTPQFESQKTAYNYGGLEFEWQN